MKQISMSVFPVKLAFEDDINLENYLHNIDGALARISKYRQINLTDVKHDILHFISGFPFSIYSGRTFMRGMCHFMKSVAIVSDYYSRNPLQTASIMAHEMAHSLGIDHDASNCYCLRQTRKCIMNQKSNGYIPIHWSNCTVKSLLNLKDTGVDYCLYDLPNVPKETYKNIPINCRKRKGIKNICDVNEEKWTPASSVFEHCCNRKLCQLTDKSQCSSGECCDPTTCKYLQNKICRRSTNECDKPEFCSGNKKDCPSDSFAENGKLCQNNKGYCFNGKCESADLSCKIIFGSKFNSAREECYMENIKGSSFQGYCGYRMKRSINFSEEEYEYFKCLPEDAFCGSLKCDYPFPNTPNNINWQTSLENINYITYEDKTHCYFGQYNTNLTGVPDPTMVPNGSPCGVNKYCVNRKCVSIHS